MVTQRFLLLAALLTVTDVCFAMQRTRTTALALKTTFTGMRTIPAATRVALHASPLQRIIHSTHQNPTEKKLERKPLSQTSEHELLSKDFWETLCKTLGFAKATSLALRLGWNNKPEVTRLLCETGVRLAATSFNGHTCLHDAIHEIIRLQQSHRTVEQQENLSHYLAIVETLLVSKAPINTPDVNGNTPLHMAAASDDASCVKLLLTHCANIDIKNNAQFTPIYCAVGNENVLRVLLEHKADVHTRCKRESTPLHAAAVRGKSACVQMLLNEGALVNATAQGDITALHVATHCNHLEAVKTLIDNKANVHARTVRGETPLTIADDNDNDNDNIVMMLIEAGAELSPADLRCKNSTANSL